MNIRHPEKINRKSNPLLRKPEWIRVKAPISNSFKLTKKILDQNKVVTVCEEIAAPLRYPFNPDAKK